MWTPDVVTAVYQDRAGFIWIGSREGLLLHDGYEFKAFRHDVSDPASLSDNTIRTIYEDSAGRLWIGTNAGGLDLLDRATWRFRSFHHDSADDSSISHDSVYCIEEDTDGRLWVGTQIGLNRLDPTTGRFERLEPGPSDPPGIRRALIHDLHRGRDGALWIAAIGLGLARRDPVSGWIALHQHDTRDPASLPTDRVTAIAEDDSGRLWVGSEGGLSLLEDPPGGRFRTWGLAAPGAEGLRYELVTSLFKGHGGALWAGTWGGGIHEIDTARGRIRAHPYRHEAESPRDERVTSLTVDSGGDVWFGTWGGGLRRLRPAAAGFETLVPPPRGAGLSFPDATALLHDRRGSLWIGSTGLTRFDPGAARPVLLGTAPGSAPGIGTVLSLAEDREGAIWAGAMTGLHRINAVTLQSALVSGTAPPDPRASGYVTAVLADSNGRIWFGTGEGGIHLLSTNGATFETFAHDPADPRSLSDDYVTVIREDARGTLWIGTRSGGLNAFEPASRRARRFQPVGSDPESLSHHHVTSILEDSEGRLWIGTAGGGLNLLAGPTARAGGRFRRLTEKDGLADDNVMGLAEDGGTLWVSTRRGLSRFEPGTARFVNFGLSDDLPTDEFNPGAVSAGPSAIVFGTARGAVRTRRGTPMPTAARSPTLITTIRTPRGPWIGTAPAWDLAEMRVPYGEILSFEFSVLDFREAGSRLYSYRLEGLRDDWIHLGERRQITLTDLQPGSYRLQVRGRSARGVWSESHAPLGIEVIPPFWMTGWFRAAALGAILAVAGGAHLARTSALRRRNEQLQALYEQLRSLTRRLGAAAEDERKRIAQELHDEMGQALTAVKISVQMLAREREAARGAERLTHLVGIIDQMIRHVRQLSLDLRPPLLDELGLIPALRGYLEAASRDTGVKVDVATDVPPGRLSPEIEIAAFRIAQEAVTNVLRHAGATRAGIAVRRDGPWLRIDVEDDGRGFDVAAGLERAAAGRHLGLLGMQERARSLGGSVEIDSVPGGGTRIRARVSIAKEEADAYRPGR